MTSNENLHALLLAFHDAVKKLVHDAVEAEREALCAELNDLRNGNYGVRVLNFDLECERQRSANLIAGLKIMAIGTSPESQRAKELLAEYESQSK